MKSATCMTKSNDLTNHLANRTDRFNDLPNSADNSQSQVQFVSYHNLPELRCSSLQPRCAERYLVLFVDYALG